MTIFQELKKCASVERKKSNEWFFKTGKGEYGEGDKFLGVKSGDIRRIAKNFLDVDFAVVQDALDSEFHEERQVGVLILVGKYETLNRKTLFLEPSRSATARERLILQNHVAQCPLKRDASSKYRRGWKKQMFCDSSCGKAIKVKICKFYLKNLKRVNNWDLVDLSAHRILGQAILDGIEDEKVLDKLSGSENMWERRVAIISTAAFIKTGKFGPTLRIAEKLLGDKEDLMHKAVGWMLREVWKKDNKTCEDFLIKHYSEIPRTALRYAIERMEEGKRKRFLNFSKP